MTAFEFRNVRFAYSSEPVLRDFSLSAPAGSITAVIGPSGSGKTTLLRLLAGFEKPAAGSVLIDGTEVARAGHFVPPHRRGIGIVPQEGALFPHLRVRENVAFGLAARGPRTADRVNELLQLTGLSELSERYPRELSGGQQQRVAVARALAPRPSLVLLDEPFASLDPATRQSVRAGVREALASESAAGVLVTHDHEEALSLGDQIAVMAEGQLLQCGTPEEVYQRPANEQVAHLLGDATLLEATRAGDRVSTALGELELLDPSALGRLAVIRPTQVEVSPDGVPALVRTCEYAGSESLVTFELPGTVTVLARLRGVRPEPGQRLGIGVRGAVHLVGDPASTPGPADPRP